jgi:SAM-dependent methyltransferase
VSRDFNYSYLQGKWHPDTSKHDRQMANFIRDLLAPLLPEDKKIHILDFGCGMGYALTTLHDMGYSHLEGIDIDSGMVQICLDKKLPVALAPSPAEYLKNHPESYDLILALDVIEHIPRDDQIEYIQHLYNSLRAGGTLICTVPSANSAVAVRQRYADWTHHALFTEHSLDFLLHHGGFQDIAIRGAGSPTRPTPSRIFRRSTLRWLMSMGFHAFRRLEMIAELGWNEVKHTPLSVNLLAVARKSPPE